MYKIFILISNENNTNEKAMRNVFSPFVLAKAKMMLILITGSLHSVQYSYIARNVKSETFI